MKAQITSFKQQSSKYGDRFFYVFFKNQDGKSFRSCETLENGKEF